MFYPSLKDDIWRKCNGTPGFIAAKHFMWLFSPNIRWKVQGVRLEDIESLYQYEILIQSEKSSILLRLLVILLFPPFLAYIFCNKQIREQLVKREMSLEDFTLSILYYVLEQKENV
jgi:hypothetical protein